MQKGHLVRTRYEGGARESSPVCFLFRAPEDQQAPPYGG